MVRGVGTVHWAQGGLEWTHPRAGLPAGQTTKLVGLISAEGERQGQAVHWASLVKGVGYWQESQILTAGLSYLC